MTPALVITLMILGWSAAAVAMLWGILRTARYHQRYGTRREDLTARGQLSHQSTRSSKRTAITGI